MDDNKLLQVEKLLNAEKAAQARQLFETIDESETAEYWLVKGKIEMKFQNLGKATNAFIKVQELDPENGEAKHHIQIIKGILSFWNPDQFNP